MSFDLPLSTSVIEPTKEIISRMLVGTLNA